MTPDTSPKSTILLVDDDATNLAVLVNYLQRAGFDLQVAKSGEFALTLVQHKLPDLILLDIMMRPGIDGFETCRRLKADERTRDIPVIFITALTDTADKVTGFQAGGVDYITKPFEEQEVLARVRTHLTLRKQQQQLQYLNASKDKFFAIIAHDLIGPFGSFRDLIQTMADNFANYSPEHLYELLQVQLTSANGLYRLLTNLLTWSRLQRGKMDYAPRELPLGLLAADVLTPFQASAEHKQIAFRNAIPQQLKAYGDVKMVETVMRNLVANALKFTHPGGTITLEAHQEEAAVTVAVSDTGVGIPAEHLPDLFQIETKFRREGTQHENGAGLGLLLCKEFIEKHGGRISVESEVGRGTTVRFTLPQAAS